MHGWVCLCVLYLLTKHPQTVLTDHVSRVSHYKLVSDSARMCNGGGGACVMEVGEQV